MHSADSFDNLLGEFCALNHKMLACLHQDEPDVEEISHLVDIREQLLHQLLSLIGQNEQLANSKQWQQAVDETKSLVKLMEEKTNQFGLSLRKYQHGKRSVQQYKKFL